MNLQSGFAATHGDKAMPYREAALPAFEAAPPNLRELPGKTEPFRHVQAKPLIEIAHNF